MSLNFNSLKTKEGLAQLDAYLASRVYVFGLEPTTQDTTLFGLIGSAPESGFGNVTRYYNHIQSFSAEAQAKFITIDGLSVTDAPVAPVAKESKKDDDDDSDSDIDLGLDSDSDSDDEEEGKETIQEKAIRLAKEAAAKKKKTKKRRPPERSEIILDVKPFDSETDLEALAKKIKGTCLTSLRDKEYPGPNEDGETWADLEKQAQEVDERITLETGHHWGENHQLEEMAFGIKKLRIQCVVQNELVGSDLLIALITETWPDEVQSVDVAGFQKM